MSDEIDVMLPGASDTEKELRRRLIRARTLATQNLMDCEPGSQSHRLYWMVCELVTAWLYQPMKEEVLKQTVDHCLKLFAATTSAKELGL